MAEASPYGRNLTFESNRLSDLAGCEPACRSCEYRAVAYVESCRKKHDELTRLVKQEVLYHASMLPFFYREKSVLRAFRRAGDSLLRFGFSKRYRDERGRHRVESVAIESCPVHSERVRRIIAWVQSRFSGFYYEDFPILYLAVSGRLVTFVLKHVRDPKMLDRVSKLLEDAPRAEADGWFINWNPSAGFRVFDSKRFECIAGSAVSEIEIAGRSFCHGPGSFIQNEPRLQSRAIARVSEHLRITSSTTSVLDLYCGIGATSRVFGDQGARVLSVELSGEAVDCARVNAPGAKVLRGRVSDRLREIEEWVEFERHEGRAVHLYLNPPRGGVDDLTLQVIAGLTKRCFFSKFAYLSCHPSKMIRDLEGLLRCAVLAPLKFEAFDFFPHTRHVELLALGSFDSLKQ